MKLRKIQLHSFRKHNHLSLELDTTQNNVNIIYGDNGSGKTNILEAIHIACLSKNFLSLSDSDCVTFGDSFYEISADFESNHNIQTTGRVYYSETEGKHIFLGKSELEHFSKLIGEYPCISLSPDDMQLAKGTPQERRRFLDSTISQTNRLYLSHLQNYKRSLTQRNKILNDLKIKHTTELHSLLDVWTENLCQSGASIMKERILFTREFSIQLQNAYHSFHTFTEQPTLVYDSDIALPDTPEEKLLFEHLWLRYGEVMSDEVRRGVTLFGPHRDDLSFRINDFSIRKFASQGQQKTFVICLKLAQRSYIESRIGEQPIFLLDDVFSELDQGRCEELISLLQPLGQSIITTTEPRGFKNTNEISILSISNQNDKEGKPSL
ncbi:MAG: DNA replication and repair protein RecF [Chloroherpetonaceae bacterium]|nr:DNA replication and repair protein RecF [Chloroherpetonaceae bacterium]